MTAKASNDPLFTHLRVKFRLRLESLAGSRSKTVRILDTVSYTIQACTYTCTSIRRRDDDAPATPPIVNRFPASPTPSPDTYGTSVVAIAFLSHGS